MNIHEYQAKSILKASGIPVPRGRAVASAARAEQSAEEFGGTCVVKAQVHAGGRGKAGGVRLAKSAAEARQAARELLGKRLVTKQTGPEGLPVKRLLIEEVLETDREFYLSITLDRITSRFCLISSPAGGMDIEEVARTSPEKIHTLFIDPLIGIRPFHVRGLALDLGLKGAQADDFVKLAIKLYGIFLEKDCSLIEINPLVTTKSGSLIAMDCKINFDDIAFFRHRDYENWKTNPR